MTYRAGTRGLAGIGIPDGDPRITCDHPGCTTTLMIKARSGGPPAWLLDRRAAPRWRVTIIDDGARRLDYCPDHKRVS